jgi:RPA family protein
MAENTEKKSYDRWPACMVRISDILNSEYVKVDEEFSPDYVKVGEQKISRANIIAIVVDKHSEERFSTITVDDGTGNITVRDFDNKLNFAGIDVGQIVRVIGKPRIFNNQYYLVGEIIKILNSNKWIELRKLELALNTRMSVEAETQNTKSAITTFKAQLKPFTATTAPKAVSAQQEAHEEILIEDAAPEKENSLEKVLRIIKELDKGDGADIEEVVVKANMKEADMIITNLIKEGEIFEIKRGRVKVL